MRDLPLLYTTMVDLAPRPLPSILLLALLPVAAWFVVRPLLDPVPPPSGPIHLLWILNIRILGNVVSCSCTWPHLCQGKFERKGLVKSLPHANVRSLLHGLALFSSYCSPESLGLVCASVYILTLLLFTPFAFSDSLSQRVTTHEA